jgi:ubiquinone/menaquinone biosynthesis C-methylase UbiE
MRGWWTRWVLHIGSDRMMNETWHSVWERKGSAIASNENYSEDALFAANGYDTPLGVTSARSRRHMLRTIAGALKIAPHKSLLDVGCGSGAMLSMLRDRELQLSGVDFSASLVELARRSLKDADIRTAEAAELPFASCQFDMVLCHGVFLYFQDFQYAGTALKEMLRVCQPRARIWIGDIPDLDKKDICLAVRRAAGASLTPEHLFYSKQFFETFAAACALRPTIVDQDVPDYANSPFRFNVLLERGYD